MDLKSYAKSLKTIISIVGITVVSAIVLKKFLTRKPQTVLRSLIYKNNPVAIERIHTQEESVTDGDFNFVVYLKSQESQKPKRGARVTNPFLYPFEPGMLIRNYGNSYRLLYNKYPVVDKHLLLVTFQYEKQSDLLTREDLEKAYEIICEIDGFAFYNSGEYSGHSQDHKHIQILPYESLSRFPLEQHIPTSMQDTAFTLPCYDFKHFFHPISNPKEELHIIYSKLLGLLTPTSYNLILTQNWMLMVSRAKERSFNRFDLNSVAYAGFILVKSPEDLEYLKQVGPLQILRDAASQG